MFEYDLLAGSESNKRRATVATNGGGRNQQPDFAVDERASRTSFQTLSPNGEKLINEITGLLGKARNASGMGGEGSLLDMGKTLIADLKEKMGAGGMGQKSVIKEAMPPPLRPKEPTNAQDFDPKTKYMAKVKVTTVVSFSVLSESSDHSFPHYETISVIVRIIVVYMKCVAPAPPKCLMYVQWPSSALECTIQYK